MRLSALGPLCLAATFAALPLIAQTSAGSTGTSSGSQSRPATVQTTHRTTHPRRNRTHRLPAAASAQPSTTTSSATDTSSAQSRQRAEDARVLARQQARSDKEALINNEQVRQAQARQDAQQREIRIQDAPGPAQTGVVPAAGQPVQPQTDSRIQDQRIQDQPSAVPGQNTTPPQR